MSKWLDHSSIVGHLGKYGQKISDPLSWISGGKWANFTSDYLPEKVNSGLSTVMKPFDKVDETINPVRKIPIVDRAGDIVKNKPGDALAITAGAVFGGGAALAGGGGGAAGGGAAAGGDGLVAAGGGGTAMGGSAGTLGAADSSLASTQLGLTAADVGGTSGATAGFGGAGAGEVAFNPAQDSQLANEQLGLKPVTTDDTLQGLSSSSPSGQQSQQFQQQGGQQQRRRRQPVQTSPIAGLSAAEYQAIVDRSDSQIAQSSKAVKTRGATQAAMQRGLAGAHPVDTNGVHIAAIQELKKQIDELGTAIAAAKAKRAAKGARA